MLRTAIDRRAVLRGALGGVGALTLAPLKPLAAAEDLSVTPLTDTLNLVEGAGGNVLARSTPGAQTLVDSGAAALTARLSETLVGLPGGGRVEKVFNTHWHRDQVGGNATFGADGATIVAHEKTRVRLQTPYYLGPHEDRYEPALPEAGHADERFFTRGETTIDGEPVEYGYLLEAHTDGDIYVFFRDSNVVAVGDVVSPVRDPVLDWFGGGWLGGRVDSLKLLLELGDERTRFVPSYGPAVGRAEVQAEHDFMLAMFEIMLEYVRKGYSAEDIVAEGVMDSLDRTLDDPLAFVYAAHKGFWAHHNTLSPDVV